MFIILEIKVVLISCSLSKVASKACREQWVGGFDEPPLSPPAEQYPGGSGELSKQVNATRDRGS